MFHSPKFIEATSSEQMSGFSSTTCCTRRSAVIIPLLGPAVIGSAGSGTKRPPGPVVRLMMTGEPESRMRSTTSR